MGGLTFSPEVTIGNILTIASVILSVATILLSWRRNRQVRIQEQADKIRRAAGTVAAKLERWKELSLYYITSIQPAITDADVKLIQEKDVVSVRDWFWRSLTAVRVETSRLILQEEIEVAYVDLYGYDPRIRQLFAATVELLKLLDLAGYDRILELTQAQILCLDESQVPFQSAQLGNELRWITSDLGAAVASAMDQVLDAFRTDMIRLIEASDSQIINRKVPVSSPEDVLPDENTLLHTTLELLSHGFGEVQERRTSPQADPVDTLSRECAQRALEDLASRLSTIRHPVSATHMFSGSGYERGWGHSLGKGTPDKTQGDANRQDNVETKPHHIPDDEGAGME